MNKMLRKSKSASLIRVSTIVPHGNAEVASADLQSFVEELYPHLVRYL